MKNLNSITDKEIVLEYQAGNKQVISLLVKRWHVQFCKLAFWYVKDTDVAKDIAQESWQTILHKLPTLENPERFKSWSISIVNRKAIDWMRANKRTSDKYQKYYKEHKRNIFDEDTDEQQELKNKLLKTIYRATSCY